MNPFPQIKIAARHAVARACVALFSLWLPIDVDAQCDSCAECLPRVAVKTNLLHDALLTPDLGVELALGRRWSVSASGVWAWWSNDERHRYWRIYGASAEVRFWPGGKPLERALTGHHAGIYGSMHSFDFRFGGKGWQSPALTFGAGVSYGYSWAVGRRLNIDVSLRAGYCTGKLIRYRPQCDMYVCRSHTDMRYFGITGLEVTLVWFPGRGSANLPVYDL